MANTILKALTSDFVDLSVVGIAMEYLVHKSTIDRRKLKYLVNGMRLALMAPRPDAPRPKHYVEPARYVAIVPYQESPIVIPDDDNIVAPVPTDTTISSSATTPHVGRKIRVSEVEGLAQQKKKWEKRRGYR